MAGEKKPGTWGRYRATRVRRAAEAVIAIEKRGVGRPQSVFFTEEQMEGWGRLHMRTNLELAATVGYSRQTIEAAWRREPKLREAYERGRALPKIETGQEKFPTTHGAKRRGVNLVDTENLAAYGCSVSQIAHFFEMEPERFRRMMQRKKELRRAVERGVNRLERTLLQLQVQKASAGSEKMLIWLGKQLLGQKDVIEQQITGEDGGPIQIREVRVTLTPIEGQGRVLEATERVALPGRKREDDA